MPAAVIAVRIAAVPRAGHRTDPASAARRGAFRPQRSVNRQARPSGLRCPRRLRRKRRLARTRPPARVPLCYCPMRPKALPSRPPLLPLAPRHRSLPPPAIAPASSRGGGGRSLCGARRSACACAAARIHNSPGRRKSARALRAARPEMTVRHAEFGLVLAPHRGHWRSAGLACGAGEPRSRLRPGDPRRAGRTRGFRLGGQRGYRKRNRRWRGAGRLFRAALRVFTGVGARFISTIPRPHSGQRDEGASQHQRPQQRQADEAASAAAPDGERPQHRESGLFA